MNDKLYGAWLMDLAAYFINKQKYQLITLSKNNDEIWLVNSTNKMAPLILITTQRTQDFDDEIILKQRETLATVFQTSPRGINISVNAKSDRFDDLNVGVGVDFVSPSTAIESFEGIRSVLKESKNVEFSLAKSLINLKRTLAKSQMVIRKPLYATYILMALLVVSFIGTFLFLNEINNYDLAYIVMGGFYKPLVVEGKEFLRFFTSAFITTDLFELILCLMIVRNAGKLVEPQLGPVKYLGVFFGGIFFSNLMLFITNDAPLGAGIIPGICALLGYILVIVYEAKAYRNQRILSQVISLSIITALYISLPTISNYGLFGSLFLGILIGFAGTKSKDWSQIRKVMKFAIPAFMLGMVLISLKHTQYDFNKPVHEALISVYKHFNLDWYANHLQNIIK